MNILRNASKPSTKGSPDYFTGTVRIDSPFQTTDPARVGGAIVTFEPGAHRMAYPSAGPDRDYHKRPWLGAARRRTARGNPPR